MIISVEELRQYIDTDEADSVLEAKLSAIETMIRACTHNNFQNRNIRIKCDASASDGLKATSLLFDVGDTVQLTESAFNSGIYTIDTIDYKTGCMKLNEALYDESGVLVTKIVYPEDIVQCAVNMMKWELDMRDKVGIQSETISRHAVTYFDMSGDNSSNGYPKSLTGFLKPYMKMKGWN